MNIEKGLVPPKARGHTRPLKYPWDQMVIGDSILIKGDFYKREAARIAAYSYGKRKGLKFISRWVPEGLRIWRVS